MKKLFDIMELQQDKIKTLQMQEQREKFFHQHKFYPSEKRGYEKCDCGTYHSTELWSPEKLYENNYWTHANGHSTIDEQVYNILDRSSGKAKFEKVIEYVNKGRVLEIGCAPGVIMQVLTDIGCEVTGIEPDFAYIPDIRKIAGWGPKIINGYFPECMEGYGEYDAIVATDIVEHIEDYDHFIQSAKDQLKKGGIFLFMSPIILEDGKYREHDFSPSEHAWIFSKTYLEPYLLSLFSDVQFDFWQLGHNIVICKK